MAAVAVALLAFANGACIPTGGGPDANQEGINDAGEQGSESSSVSSIPRTDTPPVDDGIEQFDDTFTYDDGLSVQIRRPAPYHPSASASGARQPYDLSFTVEIVNGTRKSFELASATCSAQSGNREATQIFDYPRLVGPPATSLLPRREVTYRIGFSVQNPDDLVVEFAPGFEYEPVIYDLHEDPADG